MLRAPHLATYQVSATNPPRREGFSELQASSYTDLARRPRLSTWMERRPLGEVHDMLNAIERQAGQDAHADAAAVGISQGGVPGASEMTDEVSQCFGLAYFLDGQHIRSQLGDGSGQGGEFGLVGRRL